MRGDRNAYLMAFYDGTKLPYPMAFHGQYDDVECSMAMCVLHHDINHDAVNRMKIRMKIQSHAFFTHRSAVENNIEGSHLCKLKSKNSDHNGHFSHVIFKMLNMNLWERI